MEHDMRNEHEIRHEVEHPHPHPTISTTSHIYSAFKRVSWGAVFAGTAVALLCMIVLNLLGIGIGAGAINPLQEQNPLSGIGIGAGIWWLASIIVSVFAGGWVAGRMAGMPRTPDGILHGIIMYALFTLIMFYVIGSAAGGIIGGAANVLGKTVNLSGLNINSIVNANNNMDVSRAQSGSQKVDLNDIKRSAYRLFSQSSLNTPKRRYSSTNRSSSSQETMQSGMGGSSSNQQNDQSMSDNTNNNAANSQNNDYSQNQSSQSGTSMQGNTGSSSEQTGRVTTRRSSTAAGMNSPTDYAEVDRTINNLFGREDRTPDATDRESAVSLIMRRTGMTREQANQVVDNWTTTYYQSKAKNDQQKVDTDRKIREAGDAAAHTVSTAAMCIFFGLILGGISAGVGGRLGEPKPFVVASSTTKTKINHDQP